MILAVGGDFNGYLSVVVYIVVAIVVVWCIVKVVQNWRS